MLNLENKTVLVTGGHGFLGRHICDNLLNIRKSIVVRFRSKNYDLTNIKSAEMLLDDVKPSYVIHCAGFNGGIVYNRAYPEEIYFKNTMMGLNIIKASRLAGVKKIVSIMTSCSYPDHGHEQILQEDYFWEGRPNSSIECHGLAKRTLDAYSRFNNLQHNFPAYTVAITNLYGEGDTFNLTRAKVVSSLIRKFVTAKLDRCQSVTCLGTGAPLREFMYAGDAAECVVRTLERYEDASLPLNIGIGSDISIKELAETISEIVGFEGEIIWDTSAGDGQMKKLLDSSRMKELLDYTPQTSFIEGLKKTIKWYIENREECDKGK